MNAAISRALTAATEMPGRLRGTAQVLVPLSAVAAATVVSWSLKGFIPDESLSMVFLLAVLVACVIHGRNAAILSALLAFLAYNFLAVEPRFRFSFAPVSDTLTIAVFLAVALLTGGLAGRVRDQARAMANRAATIGMLFDASRELAKSSDRNEITAILANRVAAATGAPADVFVRAGDAIAWAARGPSGTIVDQAAAVDFANATWSSLANADIGALQNAVQSGLIAHPLGALRRPIGLLVWRNSPASETGRAMDEQTIAVFCELGAVALERVFLMEEITKAKVLAESDRLRTALLSSISHDFRTPLSGILASATGLLEHGDQIDPRMKRELLVDVRDQAERINRYVANLLDMIKLESGAVSVRLEPTDPIDIIAAASRRHGAHGQGCLKRVYPADACLVEADPVLLEQTIFNVLDNAMQYSPAESAVEISLHVDDAHAEIVIADQGVGIPEPELERVFDKFYRVSGDRSGTQGTGLGLSICRGLVEAMGGTIRAESPVRDGRGTAIRLKLRRA